MSIDTNTALLIDLSPARWIWLPSERCLSNTFVLFRHELQLNALPQQATGWLTADSRYRLTVNGQRVQWGPAPCDPRDQEVDPMDLTAFLQAGQNIIGVEVLYYGSGDGTWVMGGPGLIFRLDLRWANGTEQQIISDESWRCLLDRSHRPGMYKRWFLRALQEEYDARLHPNGWDTPDYQPDDRWLSARVLPGASNLPAAFAGGPEYALPCDQRSEETTAADADERIIGLRRREIPLLCEPVVPVKRLTESGRVNWRRDPLDWFESRIPGSFVTQHDAVAQVDGDGWVLSATPDPTEALIATFEFDEQLIGWPRFTIDAPTGTVVELTIAESYEPGGDCLWLDNGIYDWSRFICDEGVNTFEPFDFESFRWMQLHVRGATRPVRISQVSARRRIYPWPNQPQIRCGDEALQRLFDSAINTMHNSCQETCVDGMGRERQQYSGDGGHQLQAVRYAFGEFRQPARFLQTFSQGMTLDGYFLDCWPAYDRLARIMQRQVGLTQWGPLLDHGVGFVFDCLLHYQETGDLSSLCEPYPRLLRFGKYLQNLRGKDGLLPVEALGVTDVWIDHDAYLHQRHKQCAFNLYAAAMFEHGLTLLARVFNDESLAGRYEQFGRQLLASTIERFWDADRRVFINNLPWRNQEDQISLCDRSLATSILFDQCPDSDIDTAAHVLATTPPEMGLSYPCNAGWRYQALAKVGQVRAILDEFRVRWATMDSVVKNNTLQECWDAVPNSADQYSHCPLVPLFVLFKDIAGIKPLTPGFAKVLVRPQLGDLPSLDLVAHTVRGPIRFTSDRQADHHAVSVTLSDDCEGELLLPSGSECGLFKLENATHSSLWRYRLEPGINRFRIQPDQKQEMAAWI